MFPSTPDDNDAVEILNVLGATLRDRAADFVRTGLLLSRAVTARLNVPLAVGVPEITPLPADSDNPAGRLPELIDQV